MQQAVTNVGETQWVDRVAVVGSGGAGKSTFARDLGARTAIPVVHLDRSFWHPGWVETPRNEWREVQAGLVAADRWILDGNYGGTLDVRFERADTVIVLGLARWRCVARVLRRSVANLGRSVQAEACPERIDPAFARWVWRYPVDSRPRLDAAIARHPHLDVVELTSPAEVRRFLDQV